jgi:hypothetical protein
LQLLPGVVLVGLGKPKELQKKAQQAEVDVLCVFTVNVNYSMRSGLVTNKTSIALYNTADAKPMYEGKELNNIQVQKQRAEQPDDPDPVDKEMDKLFEYIDSHWKLGELPAGLQQEHVLNRLRTLISEPPSNPLPTLAEVRMYQTRGLLEDAHLLTAYQRLIGDQPGKLLATGSEEEKKQAIEEWLPKPR